MTESMAAQRCGMSMRSRRSRNAFTLVRADARSVMERPEQVP